MLLAFPGYVGGDGKWLIEFKTFFRMDHAVIKPSRCFFSAQDYLKSAFKGIEYNNLNIDLPISIGILTLFGRSTYEVVSGIGWGILKVLPPLYFSCCWANSFNKVPIKAFLLIMTINLSTPLRLLKLWFRGKKYYFIWIKKRR